MKNGLLKLVFLLTMMMPFQIGAQTLCGDVNNDGAVGMDDLTALINYLVTNDATGINLDNADCTLDSSVNMDDLTTLINYLVFNQWPMAVESFTVNGVTFKMMPVKGGTFIMGSDIEDLWARYPHEVTLSDFYIGETEVTQELWIAVMGINPSWFCSTEGYSDILQRPVECVSWYHCHDFLEKLNKLTGLTFRLPTEAEWEFAASGGNKSHDYHFSGSNDPNDVAWFKSNLPSQVEGEEGYSPQPVGLKMPNELGLYDMTGNVNEWCEDWALSGVFTYPYSPEPQVNPTGPETGDYRVIRGGSYNYANSYSLWLKYHNEGYPGAGYRNVGFRLVLVK